VNARIVELQKKTSLKKINLLLANGIRLLSFDQLSLDEAIRYGEMVQTHYETEAGPEATFEWAVNVTEGFLIAMAFDEQGRPTGGMLVTKAFKNRPFGTRVLHVGLYSLIVAQRKKGVGRAIVESVLGDIQRVADIFQIRTKKVTLIFEAEKEALGFWKKIIVGLLALGWKPGGRTIYDLIQIVSHLENSVTLTIASMNPLPVKKGLNIPSAKHHEREYNWPRDGFSMPEGVEVKFPVEGYELAQNFPKGIIKKLVKQLGKPIYEKIKWRVELIFTLDK
jgi:hypothetical protein